MSIERNHEWGNIKNKIIKIYKLLFISGTENR